MTVQETAVSPRVARGQITPAPWTAVGAEVRAETRLVADCEMHRPYHLDYEGQANARLIAAAPELLAELKDTESLCAALCTVAMNRALADHLPFGLKDRVEHWLKHSKAQPVIAKAEGQ